MAKKKFNPADEQTKLLKEAQSIGKALGMEYEDIAEIQEQILNRQIKSNQTLLESLKLAKQSADSYKQRARAEDDALRKQEDRLKLQKEEKRLINQRIKQADILQGSADDLAKTVADSGKKLFSNTADTYDAQKKLIKAKKAEIVEARKNGEISRASARELFDQIAGLDKVVEQNQKVQNEYQKQFETLSALGGFLKKNFGAVGEILEGSINKGMEAFGAEMAESGNSALSSKKAMKAFGGDLMAAGAKMFTVAGAAALLYEVLQDSSAQVKEFSNATGASINQSYELVNSAKDYAATSGLSLATAEKTLQVQQEIVSAFGSVNTLSTQTAAELAQIGETFGYGAQLAGQVQASMMSIGASAEDALKIQGFSSALAEAAGVAPGAVMKDIAQNAKTTAKYFAGNPKALAKAAVEAARIGLSLQDMASVADKLLDIESSLTAQFEASAMLGRTINMDKARQLALDGDIEGATKATLEQVGSLADFEKMSMMQRKKIAEAAGMEVGQIEKALQLQEKTKNMSAEELALVNKYGDALGDVSKMSKEDLLNKSNALQSSEKMDAAMVKLKDAFTKSLLPLAEAFGEAIAALGPIFELIGYLLIPIGSAFKYLGKVINLFITKPLERVKEFFSGIGDILHGDFEKGFKKLGHSLVSILVAPIETAINLMIAGINHVIRGVSAVGELFGFSGFSEIPDLDIATMLVGDLGIPANGGPVVMSPRENTIFQGTKNDDVAMYPGATDVASGGGSTDMSETNSLLRQLLSAMKTPVPVVIGDKAINEIGKQYATNSTYKPAGSR